MDDSSVVTPPYLAGPLRLLPFRGLMLAPSRIGDPASARAFVRPYREVADRLLRWERSGHVHRDARPAVYLHEYTSGGITVRGLVGALDLSRRAGDRAERAVFPHEGIHPLQVADLADRMLEMQVQPAPILLVHRGHATVRTLVTGLLQTPAEHDFVDRGGQQHRVWAVRDPEQLAALDGALAHSRALIADGHHRYAAYLQLQDKDPGGPCDRGLAMLVDQDDTPLFLGPIHRVLAGTSLEELAVACADVGARLERASEPEAVAALGPHTLAATDGRTWATVRLEVPRNRAAVEVLHDRLVPALRPAPVDIGRHHSVDDALRHLAATPGVALLLPAPDFDLVLRIVAAGRLLPEKATSFQPKPHLGVLIRSLRDGSAALR
jgi:uncharacterized protein (DUF1015 family)